MSSDQAAEKLPDQYAKVSFWLALFLLVWPVQADLLAFAPQVGGLLLAVAVVICCTGPVLWIWIVSLMRHRREPGVWSGRGYLIGTGIILAINFLAYSAAAATYLLAHRAAG